MIAVQRAGWKPAIEGMWIRHLNWRRVGRGALPKELLQSRCKGDKGSAANKLGASTDVGKVDA